MAVPVRRNADKFQPLVDQIGADGGLVVPIGCDARCEDQKISLFDRIGAERLFDAWKLGNGVRSW